MLTNGLSLGLVLTHLETVNYPLQFLPLLLLVGQLRIQMLDLAKHLEQAVFHLLLFLMEFIELLLLVIIF